MWDEPEEPAQDLDLRLLRVGAQPLDDSGALRVRLETTRGPIEGILHPVEGGTTAVICVGGAMGGLDGPADKLYARLPLLLSSAKVTVLRVEYRKPNEFEECVLDVLAGCSFMKGIGATVALPIWIEIMQDALKDKPGTPFRTPPGISLVRVSATSGRIASGGGSGVIAEAFIPGTEPGRERSEAPESDDKDPFAVPRAELGAFSPSSDGLY